MKPKAFYRFKDGPNFSPSAMLSNLRTAAHDINEARSRRYTYSSFVLDYTGVSSTTTTDALEYRFQAPWDYDIVGIELVAYASSNVSAVILQALNSGGSDAVDVRAEVTGVNVRAAAQFAGCINVPSSVENAFILSPVQTGAWTMNSCRVTVYIRTDRSSGSDWDLEDDQALLPRPGLTTSATDMNTILATGQASADALTGGMDISQTLMVVSRRNLTAAPLAARELDNRIPASSRRLTHMQAGLVCAATSSMAFSFRDTAAASLSSFNVTGNGATNLRVSSLQTTPVTLAVTDPDDSNDDNYARINRNSGTDTIVFAYLVLFFDR